MDDYRDAIASCCRQLRLSANLVDNAMNQSGESHQEYLYNLLREEIRYRKATRVAKLVNTAVTGVTNYFCGYNINFIHADKAE